MLHRYETNVQIHTTFFCKSYVALILRSNLIWSYPLSHCHPFSSPEILYFYHSPLECIFPQFPPASNAAPNWTFQSASCWPTIAAISFPAGQVHWNTQYIMHSGCHRGRYGLLPCHFDLNIQMSGFQFAVNSCHGSYLYTMTSNAMDQNVFKCRGLSLL